MKPARAILCYVLLAAIAATTVLPAAWMVLTSLHAPGDDLPTMRDLVPQQPYFSNYAYVLTFPEVPIARFLLNSLLVSGGVILLQLFLCSTAAFALARLRFAGRDALFTIMLVTMMIPAPLLIVPLFSVVQQLGWLDTYLGLIVPYPYLSTAFGVFLLRQYLASLPTSLDEAARLDGCGDWGVYWHIALPAARPALASLAAFAFIWSWTDFYWPLLATSSTDLRTLEVGLSVFKNTYGQTQWPLQMTAAVIVLAPVVAFFLLMQRYFVRGAVTSGLKE